MGMTVGMEMIDSLLETVSFSGYLRDEKPISLILAAPQEHNKTSSIMALESSHNVLVTSFTPYGFMEDYYEDVKKGDIRYILVPDMFALFSNGKTREDIVGFLLDLLQHGTVNISKYWSRGKRNVGEEKVKLGIVMASIPSYLKDQRHRWMYENGFLSRFLMVSYEYDEKLLDKIYEAVMKGGSKIEKRDFEYPEEDTKVTCQPRFIQKLEPLLEKTQKKQNSYGIRLREQVRVLLKANALKHGRIRVNDEDVIEIGAFMKYMNLDTNPIKPFKDVKKEVKKELRL